MLILRSIIILKLLVEIRFPNLKNEIVQLKAHMPHMKEQEAKLEDLGKLQTYDKEKFDIASRQQYVLVDCIIRL